MMTFGPFSVRGQRLLQRVAHQRHVVGVVDGPRPGDADAAHRGLDRVLGVARRARMERGGDVLPAGRGRIAVVDDDQDVVALVEHRVADAAGQAVMPEAAVAHHRDGALAGLDVQRRSACGAKAVAHGRRADIERREDREQVAADIGADVMLSQFALDELHRGEDRPLRAAGAERRRTAVHVVVDRVQNLALACFQRRDIGRRRVSGQQIRPHLLDELADAGAHHAAGVFAGHRQHVLAVHAGLDVGAAQDGVDVLLDVVRLRLPRR